MSKHCLLVCVLLVAVAAAAPKAHELTRHYSFGQYLADFKKSYASPAEHSLRESLFAQSLADALDHNSRPSSYKKGINRFSDWTAEELAAIRGGRYEPKYEPKYASTFKSSGRTPAAEVDYRKNYPPVVSAVKDQGQCGDCWAHAVTEAVESAYAVATGQLFVLSQQQVTSCTPKAGSCYACEGSYPTLAYDYLVENGITEEWIYPFEGYNNTNYACSSDPYISTPINTIVNISGYILVGPNDQNATVQALNELGPLSILVDASGWSSYESGIYDGCSYADNITLDHAVMVVGYGSENGTDYWIVRNSWAPSWGEIGYIRLAKPPVAHCGWNTGAGHAQDCYGNGPSAVWSCGMCGILFGGAFPSIVLPTPAPASNSDSSTS
jgi:cathepsin L